MALAARSYARLPTERANPDARHLDLQSPLGIVRLMGREDARAARAVARQAPVIARAARMLTTALSGGGRLLLIGAGTSGRLGVLEAAECPTTFGVSPRRIQAVMAGGRPAVFRAKEGAEDDVRAGARAVSAIKKGDVVVAIAASGVTPFARAALRNARRKDCRTILVTSNSRPGRTADIVIAPRVGPEILAGSTRLKSGTAAKLVLNMLTTAAMIGLGKVYDGWMVDLKITNRKLQFRAERLVRDLGEVGPARARGLLRDCRGSVKVAVVMARRKVTAARARRLLALSGGFLRRALEQRP